MLFNFTKKKVVLEKFEVVYGSVHIECLNGFIVYELVQVVE